MLRLARICCLLAIAVSPASFGHTTPDYPPAPVKLVVGYPAGNASDLLARALGDKLAQRWKQAVVIENKPGVAGSLAAAFVAKAPNDGQTLLFVAAAAMAVNPHVYKNVGYKPLKDFDYIRLVAWAPLVCVVAANSKIESFDDAVKVSQQKPLNFGTAGVGSIPHLTLETFKSRLGLNAMHVPYKSATAVQTDLVGGRIDITCDAISAILPLIRGGRVKAIAVTSQQRLPILPQVPTIAESHPGYNSGAWLGILAPKGVSAAITERVSRDVKTVLEDKAIQTKLANLGFEILNQDSAAFFNREKHDYEKYGQIARELKLKPY
jgi:tripartite-type tricarboxylate transporter receptor subunit TctC